MERPHRHIPELYELNQTDFAQTGGFYDNDPLKERIYFKDPISRERLNPTDIPACIEREDPMCAQGLEWLSSAADRLNVALLLNHHGNEGDFHAGLRHAQAGKVLAAAQFIAVEANFSSDGEGVTVEPRHTRRGQFQQAQMQWIARENKLALPCDIDYPQDPAQAKGTLRRTMFEHFYKSYPQRDAPPTRRQKVLSQLGNMYYQSIREDMMIGQLGYWMSELEQRGALPDYVITVPFMVGSFHLPLAEKFRNYMNASSAVHIIKPYEPAEIFAAIFRQGYVTYNQLGKLVK